MENVWDDPRPPAPEPVAQRIRILFAGSMVANKAGAFRGVTRRLPLSMKLIAEIQHTGQS